MYSMGTDGRQKWQQASSCSCMTSVTVWSDVLSWPAQLWAQGMAQPLVSRWAFRWESFGCLGSHILRRVLWSQEEELSLLMVILNRRAGESCLLCLPHFPPHTALPTTPCNPILILHILPGEETTCSPSFHAQGVLIKLAMSSLYF
jgi:hypothetical protein